MNTLQQTALTAVKDLSSALPVEGKVEVLNHLLGELNAKDLKKLSPEARQALLVLLPEGEKSKGVVAEATVAPHKLCNLEVQEIALGTQVTFTIPKGMSGKMVLDAIEKANPRAEGDGVVWPDSALLKDVGLSDIVDQDTKYTTTVCFNSNNRNRSEQATYLKDNGLGFTDRWITTVAAALYRDANGFPEDRFEIGTSKDKGDLFKGKVARARSGAVGSYADGVYAYSDNVGPRFADVVAAGSSPSN